MPGLAGMGASSKRAESAAVTVVIKDKVDGCGSRVGKQEARMPLATVSSSLNEEIIRDRTIDTRAPESC